MSERMVRFKKGIFPYADKAPFEASGESVRGALEIDLEADTVKCHECGGWFENVGKHAHKHGLTGRQYRAKHALTSKSPLCSQRTSDERRERALRIGLAQKSKGRPFRKGRPQFEQHSAEHMNLHNDCPPQFYARLAFEIKQKGRFLTNPELKAAKISRWLMEQRYGSNEAAQFACSGDTVCPPRALGRTGKYLYSENAAISAVVEYTVKHGHPPKYSNFGTDELPFCGDRVAKRFGGMKVLLLKAALLAPAPARQALEARAVQLAGRRYKVPVTQTEAVA